MIDSAVVSLHEARHQKKPSAKSLRIPSSTSASVLEHIGQTTYRPFCPYDPSRKTEHVPSVLEMVCPVSDLLTYCQDEIQQL